MHCIYSWICHHSPCNSSTSQKALSANGMRQQFTSAEFYTRRNFENILSQCEKIQGHQSIMNEHMRLFFVAQLSLLHNQQMHPSKSLNNGCFDAMALNVISLISVMSFSRMLWIFSLGTVKFINKFPLDTSTSVHGLAIQSYYQN